MGYTPVELRHVKVRRRLLGYDRGRVEQLLDEVADSFEAVWRDRGELADRVEAMQTEVADLRAREQLLTQTLVAAEQAAVEMRDQARREADVILAEAHQEARAVARNAQGDRDRLVAEALRVEGFLRAALGLVAEVGETAPAPLAVEPQAPEAAAPAAPTVEPPAGAEPLWPQEQTADDALGFDPEPPEPQTPYLRQVVGGESRGFDWGEE